MALKDFFLENIGVRGPAQKSFVRAVILFVEGDQTDLKSPNHVKVSWLRTLRGDYTSACDSDISLIGTTVSQARHESKKGPGLEMKKSTMDPFAGVKGLLLVGEGVQTRSVVFDKTLLYEAKLVKELDGLAAFFGTASKDRFAFIFTGLAADYDGKIRTTFKERFPKIPLLGTRTSGATFGNPYDSVRLFCLCSASHICLASQTVAGKPRLPSFSARSGYAAGRPRNHPGCQTLQNYPRPTQSSPGHIRCQTKAQIQAIWPQKLVCLVR